METSIGILETKGFAAAFAAAEKILEDKKISLLKVERIGGGLITMFFCGNLDDLNKAFKEGVSQGRSVGEIFAIHIQTHANKQLVDLINANGGNISSECETKNKSVVKSILPALKNIKEEQFGKLHSPKVKGSAAPKIKTKTTKSLNSSSTIQRLRQEALFTGKVSGGVEKNADDLQSKKTVEINMSKVGSLNVHELRRFARSTTGFPIQGREISRANKKELLDYFKDVK